MLNAQYSEQDARTALHCIDPGTDRETWVRALMAAKAAGLAEDDAIGWSANAPNFSSERDVRSVWRSIKPDGGIGAGTLFTMARAGGWEPRQGDESRCAIPRTTRAVNGPPRPADVWSRCVPASASHGYIIAKRGRPDGLRVVPKGDPLRIAGASVAGWLVVPVLPLAGGEPVSLQFIPPPGEGKKLNLPGASVSGVFVVGELEPGGRAHLCEGIGQAWACWKATGAASVVCFGAGRMGTVARELHERNPSARLVLVPDVGKESEAERIARDVRGFVAARPEGWERNADVNDLAQRDGFDTLEVLLADARPPPQRFRLLGSEDLRSLPPISWLVRGVLPSLGVASLYGASGSGKSFLTLDLAAAIAEGREWFGYRVKPATVVYAALEGQAGFRLRVAAWEKSNGYTLPACLRLVLQPFRLTEPEDVRDLAAAVLALGDGAVTVLDTLNAASPGTDENSSGDMGRVIESAKELQRLTGGLVLLVAHTGKDATKGLRGHSSLLAALDAAIEVKREGDRREWQVFKAKDGKDGAAHPFRLALVDLGNDDDGEPVTSCVVRSEEAPEESTRSRLPQGGNQRVVLNALHGLLRKSSNFGKGGAPPYRPCVEIESAVEAIAPGLLCEPKRKPERTRQALTGLVGAGVVNCREGWLWLP
jgi:putative DNA primase/helicase